MSLHAVNVAIVVGAVGDEVDRLAKILIEKRQVRQDVAAAELAKLRGQRGQTSREVAYAVTSLTREQAGPEALLSLVRGHWAIESAPQAQERKVRDELTDRAQAA